MVMAYKTQALEIFKARSSADESDLEQYFADTADNSGAEAGEWGNTAADEPHIKDSSEDPLSPARKAEDPSLSISGVANSGTSIPAAADASACKSADAETTIAQDPTTEPTSPVRARVFSCNAGCGRKDVTVHCVCLDCNETQRKHPTTNRWGQETIVDYILCSECDDALTDAELRKNVTNVGPVNPLAWISDNSNSVPVHTAEAHNPRHVVLKLQSSGPWQKRNLKKSRKIMVF
jgi:hypothetical protein